MQAVAIVQRPQLGQTGHIVSVQISVQGFPDFGTDFIIPFATTLTGLDAIAKDTIVARINDVTGLALVESDVLVLSGSTFNNTRLAAVWTKDATKTNIGTTPVNAYIGFAGEPQGVNFDGLTQYTFVACGNKIGTGNLTHSLVDTANAANLLSQTYTGVAGEFVQNSGWVNLPSWTVGELNLKPMVNSSVATDDPIYRGFSLYLR